MSDFYHKAWAEHVAEQDFKRALISHDAIIFYGSVAAVFGAISLLWMIISTLSGEDAFDEE